MASVDGPLSGTYDDVTAGNKGKGRLTKITDQTGNTAFVYDARGNVTKETRTVSNKAHVVSYVYDLADRVTQITYPSGRIVIYARDANGRITLVRTRQTSTAPLVTVASSVVYQPMSNLVQSFTAGNGLTNWNTYTSDIVPEARLRHDELDLLGVYILLACCRRTREYIYPARAPIARAPISEGVNRQRQAKVTEIAPTFGRPPPAGWARARSWRSRASNKSIARSPWSMPSTRSCWPAAAGRR